MLSPPNFTVSSLYHGDHGGTYSLSSAKVRYIYGYYKLIFCFFIHKTWYRAFPVGPTMLQQRSKASARDSDSADI